MAWFGGRRGGREILFRLPWFDAASVPSDRVGVTLKAIAAKDMGDDGVLDFHFNVEMSAPVQAERIVRELTDEGYAVRQAPVYGSAAVSIWARRRLPVDYGIIMAHVMRFCALADLNRGQFVEFGASRGL
jgi:hypothetical protein